MACENWRQKLDAYADGELSTSEATEVGGHLRRCSNCAAAALEKIQLKRSVESAGRPYVPSPEFRAKVMAGMGSKRHTRSSFWKIVLAPAILVLLISLGFNWYVREQKAARNRVFSELADLHVATLASSSPVDVVSSDRHTVKPWFQGKIPFTFNLPELQGTEFSLVGGRVAYLGQSPAAQLIYRVRKHEISVFILQERDVDTMNLPSSPMPAFSFTVESWRKNDLRYFVVGDAGAQDIQSLSKLLLDAG
jgi:anti-sigma factor RsiW